MFGEVGDSKWKKRVNGILVYLVEENREERKYEYIRSTIIKSLKLCNVGGNGEK